MGLAEGPREGQILMTCVASTWCAMQCEDSVVYEKTTHGAEWPLLYHHRHGMWEHGGGVALHRPLCGAPEVLWIDAVALGGEWAVLFWARRPQDLYSPALHTGWHCRDPSHHSHILINEGDGAVNKIPFLGARTGFWWWVLWLRLATTPWRCPASRRRCRSLSTTLATWWSRLTTTQMVDGQLTWPQNGQLPWCHLHSVDQDGRRLSCVTSIQAQKRELRAVWHQCGHPQLPVWAQWWFTSRSPSHIQHIEGTMLCRTRLLGVHDQPWNCHPAPPQATTWFLRDRGVQWWARCSAAQARTADQGEWWSWHLGHVAFELHVLHICFAGPGRPFSFWKSSKAMSWNKLTSCPFPLFSFCQVWEREGRSFF